MGRRSALPLALLAALGSCELPPPSAGASRPATENSTATAAAADVRPTLSEIWGTTPLDGARPSEPAISADGRFVSYRWTPPPPAEGAASEPEAGSPAPRASLFVASSAGGELTDLGAVGDAVWGPRGANLYFLRNREVRIWEAGQPAANSRLVTTLPGDGGSLRFSPDGAHALVSSGPQYRLLVESTQQIRPIEPTPAWAIDRVAFAGSGIVLALRPQTPRPESSAAASGPAASEPAASAPAASAPQSRTARASRRVRLELRPYDGGEVGAAEFEPPAGFAVDTWIASHDGALAVVVLREEETGGGRRTTGMVANFLTEKVTTVSARGRNARDVEARRMLRVVRLIPSDGEGRALEIPPGFEAPARGSFDVEASRDPREPQTFLFAFTAEDRRSRRIYALRGEGERLDATGLLDVAGPSGGIERIVAGAAAPFVLSETSGRARAYERDATGSLVPFTPENVDVSWIAESGPVRLALVCEAARPEARCFWRTPRTPLPMEGMYAANPVLSRDGSRVAFLGARLGTAEDVYAMPTDGSAGPVRITRTALDPADQPGPAGPPRVVSYPSPDGTPIRAFLYEPPAGMARSGAAVIFLHGAGYLQQVRLSSGFPGYVGNHYFHRRLAAKGIPVLAPDYRGSAGYGRKFRADIFGKLGHLESDDVLAGKRFLERELGVDGDRVGLYGGSYGGFLTLMCMLRYPTEFACGAALRPVTDWRTYSPEYTRPLLGGSPEEVPAAYERSSPIDQAEKLERPVLLLHGMRDDNVFVQDTLRLVEKLQKAKKTDLFELMVYPSQNHTFVAPHAWVDEYRRIELFFERHLGT